MTKRCYHHGVKILVAMSGGVDSSVTAHLLHKQGHSVIGVMMKLWTDPLAPAVRRKLPKKCCSIEHIHRARSVCADLGIPFYVLNFEEAFKTEVVDPFLQAYEQGKTPNPCIDCNRLIKTGMLLEKAAELGCEALATGHYARITREDDGFALRQAADATRDQSYYLYTLTQEKLGKMLFPLGDMYKSDVFALAREFGVPIPQYYSESQDLCFYPEKDPQAFLRRYLTNIEPGDIKTADGTVVGRHKGIPFYTIGQRKGLGIGGLTIPLHVVRKDTDTRTLFVAPSGQDAVSSAFVKNLSWTLREPTEGTPFDALARTHSLGNKVTVRCTRNGSVMDVEFAGPQRGIAAGQSLVLYEGDRVIGGGVIAEDARNP